MQSHLYCFLSDTASEKAVIFPYRNMAHLGREHHNVSYLLVYRYGIKKVYSFKI